MEATKRDRRSDAGTPERGGEGLRPNVDSRRNFNSCFSVLRRFVSAKPLRRSEDSKRIAKVSAFATIAIIVQLTFVGAFALPVSQVMAENAKLKAQVAIVRENPDMLFGVSLKALGMIEVARK